VNSYVFIFTTPPLSWKNYQPTWTRIVWTTWSTSSPATRAG
jgi:hypothetical protein